MDTLTSPAVAICSVAHFRPGWFRKDVRKYIPAWFLAECSRMCTHEEHSNCPAAVKLKLEKWLCATRGSELRKAKSADTAMRCVAHVCQHGSDATRRPNVVPIDTMGPDFVTLHLILPEGFSSGHLIGRRGRYLRPMLACNPSVRVSFGVLDARREEVEITGQPDEAEQVHSQLRARLQDERDIQRAVQRQREERREERERQEKKCRREKTKPSFSLVEIIDMERDYRERNVLRRRGRSSGFCRRPSACSLRVPRKHKTLAKACLVWELRDAVHSLVHL